MTCPRKRETFARPSVRAKTAHYCTTLLRLLINFEQCGKWLILSSAKKNGINVMWKKGKKTEHRSIDMQLCSGWSKLKLTVHGGPHPKRFVQVHYANGAGRWDWFDSCWMAIGFGLMVLPWAGLDHDRRKVLICACQEGDWLDLCRWRGRYFVLPYQNTLNVV